ncbi:MAG: hypothetical protein WC150_05410 [Bacteroidia bacterium]
MRINKLPLLAMVLMVWYCAPVALAQNNQLPKRDFTYAFTSNQHPAVQHPQLTPPLPGMEVPRQTFMINVSVVKETIISTGKTSYLIIPPDAFETLDGKPVTGPVAVTYREFKNPLDIFLSGIPMKYDSAKQQQLFQSAGMFEVNATMNNNVPLKLKTNKEIKVKFAPTDEGGYQFYRLNERDGNWTHLAPVPDSKRDNRIVKINTSPALSSANAGKSLPDTTSFADRYADPDNYYYFDKDKNRERIPTRVVYAQRRVFPEGRAIETNFAYIRENRSLFRIVPILNKEREVEYIQIAEAPESMIFYELRTFSIRKWALDEPMPYREFIKAYKSGRKYFDLRVKYKEGNDFCTLEMKNHKGFTYLNINIRKSAPTRDKNAHVRFAKHYRKYNIMLKNKENYFNAKLKKDYQNYVVSRRSYSFRDSSLQVANQLFSVSSMGIYNCDQVYRMYAKAEVAPSFVFPQQGVQVRQVAVVDKAANAAFWFYSVPFSLSTVNTIALIVQGDNQQLYYVERNDLPKINQKIGTIPIHLKPISSNITKGELAAIMGLSENGTLLAQNR